MMKSRRMSAEDRRELILEAALDEFAAKGFSGARTKAIAKAADISETLIYQHFSTKGELYQQALRHLFSGHPITAAFERLPEGAEAVFHALAHHVLRHCRRDPRILRLHLFDNMDMGVPEAVEGTGHKDADTRQRLAVLIREGIGEGVFAPCDADLAARAFLYQVFMAAIDRECGILGKMEEWDDETLARELTDRFLRGMRP